MAVRNLYMLIVKPEGNRGTMDCSVLGVRLFNFNPFQMFFLSFFILIIKNLFVLNEVATIINQSVLIIKSI